ncbi:MAG: hypothetical protein QXL96_00085 [Ignisphaera sp.]
MLTRKPTKREVGIASSSTCEPRELGITYTIFPDDVNSREYVLKFIEKGVAKLKSISKIVKILKNIFIKYLNKLWGYPSKIMGYTHELH